MENKVKELKGVERHIDNLGRLVIPKEMRDKLNFDTNELVDIKLVNDHIQVSKSRTRCLFCNSENEYQCNDCINGSAYLCIFLSKKVDYVDLCKHIPSKNC